MKTLTIATLIICSVAGTFACTCMNPPTYCETVQSGPADLLILGYKFEDNYHGMGIKVVQVLDGTENRDTLTVWGDTGMLCRWYCGTFGMGDTLVFALHNCDMLGGSNLEKPDHYQISICGVYWLDYENGQVTGAIDNGVTSLGLNEFQQLNAACTPTSISEPRQTINIYPNPTTSIVTIKGFEGTTQVYDLYGRLVTTTHSNTLDLSGAGKGIYFLNATNLNGRIYCWKIFKE